jgi:hypothetical protein
MRERKEEKKKRKKRENYGMSKYAGKHGAIISFTK